MKKNEIKKLIQALDVYCEEKGLRCTPPRRLALEVIAASIKPIGAYDVIEGMGKQGGKQGEKPKPTTVYRAIEFLQTHGFIHRIESLNAFVTCHAGHTHEGSQFIICHDCGTVEEVHLCHLPKDLKKKVKDTGFDMAHWNTEIHGTCQQCQV